MEEELYSKFTQEILDSNDKVYELTTNDIQTGTIEFLIMKEERYAEYVIEIAVEQNEFSDEINYGGFTIEVPIKSYGFKSLIGKTFDKNDLIDTHGSFYIVNSYEDVEIHSITFGNLKDQKLEATIEYSLIYPNWKESRGTMDTLLKIGPIVLSNQVLNPIEENRVKAISILENYLEKTELNLHSNISNMNGFRFEYKTE
ncbi:hypothetical protein IWQ47_003044 [Aquimarina sp. EL_43]|uniref:hypothetical protein n=1 Tax=unclassified Aquimarina TaxID=2627091 RepID=UPI0018CA851A|nr:MULTISPECIES: hypothetical protein [unclassified Aquimarina]MBG6131636.1 hypothetical protein [Aquimarina sp. EL_35]MBG6152097.1 hypothetical protein [Aquimarina sp. EL_32]MBG6169959.1 hypothetical protein [Aquimarina sp. EL_43]